ADVKSRIWEAIRLQEGFEEESASILPVSPLGANKEGNNVIHLNYFRKWRMVAAASIILFITSAVLNFYFYNRYQQQKQAYTALLSDRNNLQANNQVYQTRLQEWQTALEMMADPEMAMIKMPDVSGKNSNLATVFWDKRNKDVYVMPNKLPQPATGKQYQLWALVDGKPVDAGLLNSSCNGVCKMKNIPRAEAFAITLEKQGGSVSPTMAAMMVLGKV
ncbi:MAG TPA: anti-sigma factor, partial [Segetibacter sp.]